MQATIIADTSCLILLDKIGELYLLLQKLFSVLIIDELRGRRLAKQLGLTITGTLGVLAQAKQSGYISTLKPLLDKIKQTDFRLSEQLVQETLKQVGE